MGLDMYAYAVNNNMVINDFNFIKETHDEEFFCWRKHPNLHGWMEQLYKSKGGTEEFNCVYVRLTLDDLMELRKAVTHGKLPHTTGFFFGKSDEDKDERTLLFIDIAVGYIEDGYAVYYTSWW